MQIPRFPEANHPLILPLGSRSDRDLLLLLQNHRDRGRYLVAIFCRYSPIIYSLAWQGTTCAKAADFLFASIWHFLHRQMLALDAQTIQATGEQGLQSWLIQRTAAGIARLDVPSPEEIRYNLSTTPPPLWCYLQLALDELPSLQRFAILMTRQLGWSETRISTYLQAEKVTALSPEEVRTLLHEGEQQLEVLLPEDIHQIYLS